MSSARIKSQRAFFGRKNFEFINEKTRTSLVTETTLNGSRFVVDDEDEAVFFGLNEDEDEGVISFWWCIERTKRRQSFVPFKKF